MRMEMCIGTCVDMCLNMRVDMRIDMCACMLIPSGFDQIVATRLLIGVRVRCEICFLRSDIVSLDFMTNFVFRAVGSRLMMIRI